MENKTIIKVGESKMGRLKRNQKNILLGSLCALVLVMTVAYAAFSSSLSINGTGATTNNWDIKITNIQSKDIEGSAVDASKSYTDLTASFSTEFTQPGDSITYDITVTNNGSLDAQLSEINKTVPNTDMQNKIQNFLDFRVSSSN